MGLLKKIENTINASLSSYSQIKVVPRGLPYFVDPLLRGEIRFASRVGNDISIINPDNTFKISQTANIGDTDIYINKTSKWVEIGSIISIGPDKETREVSDIIDSKISFVDPLKFSYSTSDKVLLHSTAIRVFADTYAGSDTIHIKTRHQISNGDTIGYLQDSSLLLSLTEIKSVTASYAGTTTDPYYPLYYVVTLSKKIQADLFENDTIYLRAYPAYFSNQIKVPNPMLSATQMGPFLIDTLSGRLTEGFNFAETLSLKLLDRSKNYILGSNGEYIKIDKNFLVIDRPILSHSFLFFDVDTGDIKFTPNKVVFSTINNKFRIGERLAPRLKAEGKSYRFSAVSSSPCQMMIYFNPYDNVQVYSIGTTSSDYMVTFPTGATDIDMIEITVTSASDAVIKMSDWLVIGPTVEYFQYSVLIESTGLATYQSTGLILKPYFLSTDLLSGKYDTNSDFDSGFLYL